MVLGDGSFMVRQPSFASFLTLLKRKRQKSSSNFVREERCFSAGSGLDFLIEALEKGSALGKVASQFN